MDDTYSSVRTAVSVTTKINGSRFIADVFPSADGEEARLQRHSVQKKYFDATHHCFAFVLGSEKKIIRYSDDGEPSGSAGIKIQAAIQAKDLSDTLVVVTRYFGGTKLGIGGLGRAYFVAAENGLAAVPMIHKAVVTILTVSFPFSETNPIMNIISTQSLTIAGTEYTEHHTILTLHILRSTVPTVQHLFMDATRGSAQIELRGTKTVVWE